MAKFGVKFHLPPPPHPVVRRELIVRVAGATSKTLTVAGPARVTEEVIFDEDDAITVTLVDFSKDGRELGGRLQV